MAPVRSHGDVCADWVQSFPPSCGKVHAIYPRGGGRGPIERERFRIRSFGRLLACLSHYIMMS